MFGLSMAELAPVVGMWEVILLALGLGGLLYLLARANGPKKPVRVIPESFVEPVLGADNNHYIDRRPPQASIEDQMAMASDKNSWRVQVHGRPTIVRALPNNMLEVEPPATGDLPSRVLRRGVAVQAGIHHSKVFVANQPQTS